MTVGSSAVGGWPWSARGPVKVGSVGAMPGKTGRAGGAGGAALTRSPSPLAPVTGSEASGPDPQLAVTMGFTGFGE